MKSKHTPGPWKVIKSEMHGEPMLYVGTPQSTTDFTLGGLEKHAAYILGGCPSETEANARLIAAAPELLAAAKLVMLVNPGAVYLNGTDGERYAEFDKLAAAIAKAEGNES